MVQIVEGLRYEDQVSIVIQYFPHQSFSEYYATMTVPEIQSYIRGLCISLAHIHSHQIAHRDVKPANFLRHENGKEYLLVDFGLAHTVTFQNNASKKMGEMIIERMALQSTVYQQLSNRSNMQGTTSRSKPDRLLTPVAERGGTRGFRAPEVLMRYTNQTTAIDMWSCGVILLCVLSGRYPFFESEDDLTGLAEIRALVGDNTLNQAAMVCNKRIVTDAKLPALDLKEVCERLRGEDHRLFFPNSEVEHNLYDLLQRLLDPNPRTRITAKQVLEDHPFLKHQFDTASLDVVNSDDFSYM